MAKINKFPTGAKAAAQLDTPTDLAPDAVLERNWFLFEASRHAEQTSHQARETTMDKGFLYILGGILTLLVLVVGVEIAIDSKTTTGIDLDRLTSLSEPDAAGPPAG